MPTTPSSRRHSQRNRRGSTPPTPGQNGSKLAGRIMWLPPADELSSSTGFSEESHNHPVLVLSKRLSADGKVDILFMTSFGDTDLDTRHQYSNIQIRGIYLPIDPSPPHPDNNIQLHMELDHGVYVFLRKNSYVNTRDHKQILFSLLRNYDRHTNKIYALTDASYQIVVEHSGYREPTPSVYEDRFTVPLPQYLAAQAQAERVRSQGYGTIPSVTSQPYPASRPAQNTQSDYNSYSSYQYSSAANARKKTRPSGHSSGGSPDDLSPSARVVLGLIKAAAIACGVAGVYWVLKIFFAWASDGIKDFFEYLKEVDWHKVFKAVGSWLLDVVVALAKVVKYLVVTMAKGVAWVAKSAWGLVRDWIMGTPKEKLSKHAGTAWIWNEALGI